MNQGLFGGPGPGNLPVESELPAPVEGGNADGAFSADLSAGDHHEFVVLSNSVMQIAGTPVDGRVYVFEFYFLGDYSLQLPSNFVWTDGTDGVTYAYAYTGGGQDGKFLRIIGMYKDQSFAGTASFGNNRYYCTPPELFET
jgi:hypothetical protein